MLHYMVYLNQSSGPPARATANLISTLLPAKTFGQQIWIEADNTTNYHLPHSFELQHVLGGSTEITNDGKECLTRPSFSTFDSALQHAPGGSTDVVIDFQSGKYECLTQLSFSAFCSGLWHVLGGNDFCGRVKIAILVLPLGNNVLNSITRE